MKYSKIGTKIFFLLILLIQISFPIIIANNSTATPINIKYLDPENIDFNHKNQLTDENLLETDFLIAENSVFDTDLREYLINLKTNTFENNNTINIIIEFNQQLSQEKRLELLNSIFTSYEVINNYNLINGIQIKLCIKDLIDKEKVILKIANINKIYKSKTYTTPAITDDKLKDSNLDKNIYPNWWIPAIGADDLEYDGTGVKVAVLDTGIFNHPDLNIINSSRFIAENELTDINGHGTHVAGIIGSNGASSGNLYRGVAPGVSLIDAHVGNMSGSIDDFDVIDAIEWAANPAKAGADIISMSFGGSLFEENILLDQAISNAKKNYGTIFVVSAGNSGPDYYTGSPPATNIDTISVGATNETNGLAPFSSWGPSLSYLGYPDVVAPGVNIISTSATNSLIEKEKKLIGDFFDFSGAADYVPLSGTSMSCPIVSGTIAILKEAFPSITPETARIALQEGANKLPQLDNNDFLKYGAGLINVSASIQYLKHINATQSDINNVTRVFPDLLPVKPYDLLHFPGDSQVFNLSIISGRENTIDLEIPNNIEGISIDSTYDKIFFSESGINFTAIKIDIDNNVEIGIKDFQINITINGKISDTLDITLDIRLPQKKILMESYHGLNDWLNPDYSFPQIGFYQVIKDLAMKNISTDYFMEYWQPYYNKLSDNLLLSEQYLFQYDLVVLQNPILPYSSSEINGLKNYFEMGGNILFLGTTYEKMCVDNINYLFSELGVDTEIAKVNIMDEEYIGLGSIINSIPANPINNESIFENVDKFLWYYGNTFEVTGEAESIAQINNLTISTLYDGHSQGKGRFLTFGDLHWLYYDYSEESENYKQNHEILLDNMMNYFFNNSEIAITANLNSICSENELLNISIYLTNHTSRTPLESSVLNLNLKVTIKNDTFSQEIKFSSITNGIAYNDSYKIPYSTSYIPYNIEVSLSIDTKTYNKTFKILYYNSSLIPQIISLETNPQNYVNKGSIIDITATLSEENYNDFSAYFSFYAYGFHNRKETQIYTSLLSQSIPREYENSISIPTTSSGFGIFYVVPINENFTSFYSPREIFRIRNSAPTISQLQSSFKIGDGGSISFSNTVIGNSILLQQATQGDSISFRIVAYDSGGYSDSQSDFRISVSYFLSAISESVDGSSSIWPIFPSKFITTELIYDSGAHIGSLRIPNSMEFETIYGERSISTAPSDQPTNYISILYINVIDKEGASTNDPFIIAFLIKPAETMIMAIIVIAIIAGVFAFAIVIYLLRRKRLMPERTGYQQYENFKNPYIDEETAQGFGEINDIKFCPFCGSKVGDSSIYCGNCGKKFEFE